MDRTRQIDKLRAVPDEELREDKDPTLAVSLQNVFMTL